MNPKPPAAWGKLPAFGDFTRTRVTVAQVEDWQRWLERHPVAELGDQRAHALPWSFVLSPGCLPFSGGHYVIGAIAESCDRVGRRHPFVLYQTVSRRWLANNMDAPRNLLFWLARLLSLHATQAASDADTSLEGQLRQLWKLCRPTLLQRIRLVRTATALDAARDLLPLLGGPTDVAASLHGVAAPPWSDWPHCLARGRDAWFWQQDDAGRYVAEHRIAGATHDRREPWMFALA